MGVIGRLVTATISLLLWGMLLGGVALLASIGYDWYTDFGVDGLYLFIAFIGVGIIGFWIPAIVWIVGQYHRHNVTRGVRDAGAGVKHAGRGVYEYGQRSGDDADREVIVVENRRDR